MSIVNDWRLRVAGGMATASMLWEACCIPSLLHGAGTWVQMSAKTEKKLNNLQFWFLRLVLQVGPGAPNAALLWDSGFLDMGLRVWREKIMLVLHLRCLEESSLASQMYREQKENNWPGLAAEVEEICKELGIESVNSAQGLDVKKYRQYVTEACHKLNEIRIKKSIENSVKCQRIKNENYGSREYLNKKDIHYARDLFRARYGLKEFAGNYSRNKKYEKTNWQCKCKQAKEDESHLIEGNCEIYKDIRGSYEDLDSDENLLAFFNEVLERRGKMEEEERAGVQHLSSPLAGGEPTPPVELVAAPAATRRLGDSNVQLVDHQ